MSERLRVHSGVILSERVETSHYVAGAPDHFEILGSEVPHPGPHMYIQCLTMHISLIKLSMAAVSNRGADSLIRCLSVCLSLKQADRLHEGTQSSMVV
jgi:hypothetical protein